jgi:hypothetical protein
LDPSEKEIRYILLQPGLASDPITCILGYTTLGSGASNRIPYEALSYCWGEVSNTIEIEIHFPVAKAESHPVTSCACKVRLFRITRALEAALRSLRLSHMSRSLWIDAIAINQADPKEKTQQVSLMNLVYSLAEEVVVWLGEADPHSNIVFECYKLFVESVKPYLPTSDSRSRQLTGGLRPVEIKRVWKEFTDRMLNNQELQDYTRNQASWIKNMLQRSLWGGRNKLIYSSFLSVFNRFLSRPWFRRIWVYQEVLLAPQDRHGNHRVTLIAGNSTLPWHALSDISHGITSFDFDAPHYYFKWYKQAWLHGNVIWFRHAWVRGTKMGNPRWLDNSTFTTYFTTTKEFLASDPRDKLFALLHLSTDTRDTVPTNALLSPNYEKSVERIIADFSRGGIYLPLVVKISTQGTEQSQATELQETPSQESLFDFSFWYADTYEATMPLVQDCLYSARGKLISRIRESLGLISAFSKAGDHDSTSQIAWTTQVIRQLIQTCRPDVQEKSDIAFFQNILRMLDISESDIPRWMTFGKLYLSDILSDWPEVSQEDFLDEIKRFSNAWYFQDVPSGFSMSLSLGFLQYKRHNPQPLVFLTCDGKLVLGHHFVKPGDFMVELLLCRTSFIISPASSRAQPNKRNLGHYFYSACSLYSGRI